MGLDGGVAGLPECSKRFSGTVGAQTKTHKKKLNEKYFSIKEKSDFENLSLKKNLFFFEFFFKSQKWKIQKKRDFEKFSKILNFLIFRFLEFQKIQNFEISEDLKFWIFFENPTKNYKHYYFLHNENIFL